MLQTLGTYEGKQMVLAVTLSDGNNVKYFISFRRFGYAVHSDSLKHASNESGSPCGTKAYIVGVFLEHRRTNSFQFLSSAVLVHYLRITIHNVLMVSIYPRMGVSDAQTDDQLRF